MEEETLILQLEEAVNSDEQDGIIDIKNCLFL